MKERMNDQARAKGSLTLTLRCGKRTAGSEQAPLNLERREPARREWNLTVRPSRSLGDSGATRTAKDSSAAATESIEVGGGDKSERERSRTRRGSKGKGVRGEMKCDEDVARSRRIYDREVRR